MFKFQLCKKNKLYIIVLIFTLQMYFLDLRKNIVNVFIGAQWKIDEVDSL